MSLLTFGCMFKVVWSIFVRNNIVSKLNSRTKLCLQDINLIQEENEGGVPQ